MTVLALVAYILFTCLFVVGAYFVGKCAAITWTEQEVPKLTPHQDSMYHVLDVNGEKFYFTREQVAVAKNRARALDQV